MLHNQPPVPLPCTQSHSDIATRVNFPCVELIRRVVVTSFPVRPTVVMARVICHPTANTSGLIFERRSGGDVDSQFQRCQVPTTGSVSPQGQWLPPTNCDECND